MAVFFASCKKGPEKQAPSITVSVDRDKISVGDRIAYRIRAVVEPSTPFLLKEYDGTIGPFTILENDFRESVEGNRRVVDHLYTITAFSTGQYAVEPPVLMYGEDSEDKLSASPIGIEVFSVLGETAELKDIKGPVGLKVPARTYALVGIAVLLLTCAILFLYFRGRRGGKAPPPEPVVTPREMALRELEIIRAMNLIARGMIKEYYTRICDVLRRYVEGAFNISAPEMTTEEFLDAAAVSGALNTGHRGLLGDFLNRCDLVKFARYRATKEEAESIYNAARRFVDETAPSSVPTDDGRETKDEGRGTKEKDEYSITNDQ